MACAPPPEPLPEEDRPVSLDDPEMPSGVRAAVLQDAQPGDVLWRCVRQGAPAGPLAVLGWGYRPRVVEWWLMSAEGELIEVYWLER